MTDIRRLMGRLNPATCRFDIGRGGIPELTPQDIAGALGMVHDEFAREVFCAIWWPDGARLTVRDLQRMIGFKQRTEIDRQWRAVQVARLELHIAKDEAAARGCMTDQDRRVVTSLEAKLANAKAQCWPSDPTMYPVIRMAVIEELQAPMLCASCLGRGQLMAGNLTVTCIQCDGTGKDPISSRKRAARIGRDEKTYRESWSKPYEWTYALASEAEQIASRALSLILARHAA